MPVFPHDELELHQVSRIRTRVHCGAELGARQTAVWEQWMEPDGWIPRHYHDVEEVLVFLDGALELELGDTAQLLQSPVTVVIPAGVTHSVRPREHSHVHLLACFPTADPQIFAEDGTLRPKPWADHGKW